MVRMITGEQSEKIIISNLFFGFKATQDSFLCCSFKVRLLQLGNIHMLRLRIKNKTIGYYVFTQCFSLKKYQFYGGWWKMLSCW